MALDAAGVTYRVHEFDADATKRGFGQAAAVALGAIALVAATASATPVSHRNQPCACLIR